MNQHSLKLLKEASEIRDTTFMKLYWENVERELRRKRRDIEKVQPDGLRYIQGYIDGLRFVVGDPYGDLKSLYDKMTDSLREEKTG